MALSCHHACVVLLCTCQQWCSAQYTPCLVHASTQWMEPRPLISPESPIAVCRAMQSCCSVNKVQQMLAYGLIKRRVATHHSGCVPAAALILHPPALPVDLPGAWHTHSPTLPDIRRFIQHMDACRCGMPTTQQHPGMQRATQPYANIHTSQAGPPRSDNGTWKC
jgi:hypothetical protein